MHIILENHLENNIMLSYTKISESMHQWRDNNKAFMGLQYIKEEIKLMCPGLNCNCEILMILSLAYKLPVIFECI